MPSQFALLLSLIVFGSTSACSAEVPYDAPLPECDSGARLFGRLNLALQLADELALEQLSYGIQDDSGQVVEEGTLEVPTTGNAVALVAILPEGDDYSIAISGQARAQGSANSYPCQGSTPFDILADQVSDVSVPVVCTVPSAVPHTGTVVVTSTVTVEHADSPCGVTHLIVGPLTQLVGYGVSVVAMSLPEEASYAWSEQPVDGEKNGAFADPTAGNGVATLFNCQRAGRSMLQVVITAGSCADSAQAEVTCVGDGEEVTLPTDAQAPSAAPPSTSAPIPVAPAVAPSGAAPSRRPQASTPEVVDEPEPDKVPGFCGDGIIQPDLGETCDDGNVIAGDGCSTKCRTSRRRCG